MENNLSIVKDKFKELPNNIEAEQAVIGSILVSNDIFDEINTIVSSINFYDPIHQKIFEAIESLIYKGMLANPITLKNYFEVKEIKMRPGIDTHDYDVKMRAMNRFLDEGDKVKVTLRFRGREMAHQDLGMNVLNRVKDGLEKQAKVEQYPRMEGRQMVMVLVPR